MRNSRFATLWSVLLLFLLVFNGSSVMSQETDFSVRHKLPKVQANDAGEVCLDATQWQQVMKVSSQNKGLFEWRLEVIGIVNTHNAIIAKYELLIDNYELQLKILTQRNEYLNTRIDQERQAALKVSLEDRIEKYAMWVVILGELVIIGVMGVKMMVSSPAID